MTSGSREMYRFGPFQIEVNARALYRGDAPVPLTSKTFDLLLALVRGAGRTVTKSELMAALWPDTAVEESNLTQTVFVLRKALGEDNEETGYIRTVPRQGYRFVAPVIVDGRPEQAEADDGERRRFRLRPRGIAFGSIAFVAAAIAGFISGALLWRATRLMHRPPVDPPMMRFSVDLGPEALRGIQVGVGAWFNPVISPDGTTFVFPAMAADGSEQLAMRHLDQPTVTMLPGTEGAVDPFFSPNGQWIGFFAGQKLKKIPLQGGEVVTLCNTTAAPRGASWGENDVIIANLDPFHLFRVPQDGGEPQPIGKPEQHGEGTWRWPQVLPGGENVLFTGQVAASFAALSSANVEVLSLKSGKVKVVQRGGYSGRYLPSGHLIYIRQGTLYGVQFDLKRLETHGAPVSLAEDVAEDVASQVSFSRTGTLLYTSRDTRVAPLAWLDSSGKLERVVSPSIDTSRQAETPRLSSDGKRLAVSVAGDLVVHDLKRGTPTKLTSDAAGNRHPVWAPNGQHIVYSSDVPASDGEYGIWWIRSDGPSQPQKLYGEKTPLQAFSISPRGNTIAFVRTGKERGFEIWTLSLDLNDPDHPKRGTAEPLARELFTQGDPAFSPDGGWIAYVCGNMALGGQICVRPFPSTPSARPVRVSGSGAKFPVWSSNRRDLFYVNSDNRIMVVRYTANGHSFVWENAQPWSHAQIFRPPNNALWNLDIKPDGRSFVVLAPPESSGKEPTTVHATILLNFFDELRRRLPAT